jgi:hypothetical protein
LQTVELFEKDGTILAYAWAFAALMMVFASHSYRVLRKTHKKKPLKHHAAILFTTFAIFVAIASMSHYIDSEDIFLK